MKIVTHISPHLDEVVGVWLFKKFDLEFKDSKVEFLSDARVVDETKQEDTIYLGVGRGKFDEHKGDLEDCAASLVWKDLKARGLGSLDKIELAAIEELVEWTKVVDLGRLPEEKYGDFSVPAFIRPRDSSPESSLRAIELGGEILDRILVVLEEKHHSLKDWEERIEFESKFGKSYAVRSKYINRAFCNTQDGDLYLMYDPENEHIQFYTPNRVNLDLEPIYEKMKGIDPDASWFLHQSHHMVICGSGSRPEFVKSKLSFEELIGVVKNI